MGHIACLCGFLLPVLVFLPTGDAGCTDQPLGLQDFGRFPHHRFTGTTPYSADYSAHNTRLTSNRCWQPKAKDDANDYVQVDLGTVYTICGLGTKGTGKPGYDEWITEYKIQLSMDGTNWTNYTEHGAVKLFSGNKDSSTLVIRSLATATKTRLVRFIPTKYSTYKALRIEVYGTPQACLSPLGVESGSIWDTMMTSSSSVDAPHNASAGRLYGGSSWCSSTASNTEYLQVDLGHVTTVTGIATQGDRAADKWVKSYTVRYSADNQTWSEYRADHSARTVFIGNIDRMNVHVNWILGPISARYLRWYPMTWNTAVCARIELYGCGTSRLSCNLPVGVGNGKILDGQMQASSANNISVPASTARLNYTAGPSWCASTSDVTPYLQVDLGSPYVICAVATQGNPTADQWVTTYHLAGSIDGSNWLMFMEQRKIKVFQGNFDSSTTVKQYLYDVFVARHIRFLPTTNRKGACLRVEVYGRTSTECTNTGIGLRWGGGFPDHRVTATSQFNSMYSINSARLHGPTAWATKVNSNPADHIQLDLGTAHVICAIASQGAASVEEWTKTYMVALSPDGQTWTWYQENGRNKTFTGNNDRSSVKKNLLPEPVIAKMLRIYPVTYKDYKQLRMEIYGFVQGCHSSQRNEWFLLSADPATTLSASSSSNTAHAATKAILYGPSSWCTATGINQFIQLDLVRVKTIMGIATQGNPGGTQWVTSYDLKLRGYNTNQWLVYPDLEGNSNAAPVRTQWLASSVEARYVRVVPKTWGAAGICLRMDVFGCDLLAGSAIIAPIVVSNNLTVSVHSSAGLACTVYGPASLQIEWQQGRANLTNRSTVVYADGYGVSRLRVDFTKAGDFMSGGCARLDPTTRRALCSVKFTCMAYYRRQVVSGPVFRHTRVFIELDVPVQPTQVTSSDVTDTTATLTWTQPPVGMREGPIEYYEIEYYIAGNAAAKLTETVGGDLRRMTIGGLQPDSTYNTKIRAINRIGKSGWSTVTFNTVPTSMYL